LRSVLYRLGSGRRAGDFERAELDAVVRSNHDLGRQPMLELQGRDYGRMWFA
jgi:hypothetical protein